MKVSSVLVVSTALSLVTALPHLNKRDDCNGSLISASQADCTAAIARFEDDKCYTGYISKTSGNCMARIDCSSEPRGTVNGTSAKAIMTAINTQCSQNHGTRTIIDGCVATLNYCSNCVDTNPADEITCGIATPPPSGFNNPTYYYEFDVNNTIQEPLNVIVSGASDPYYNTLDNFNNWLWAVGMDPTECFGIHGGGYDYVDLADGNPLQQQLEEPRQVTIGDGVGSCGESLLGGNHLRVYQQNGTNAWFLAASTEHLVNGQHDIDNDGYNVGRDQFVAKALQGGSYNNCNFPGATSAVDSTDPALTGPPGHVFNHGFFNNKTTILTLPAPNCS